MKKLIGLIVFILGGTLFFLMNEVWDMSGISWIVAIATLALTGKFVTADD